MKSENNFFSNVIFNIFSTDCSEQALGGLFGDNYHTDSIPPAQPHSLTPSARWKQLGKTFYPQVNLTIVAPQDGKHSLK